jgi:hypothetical protein
MVLALMVGMRIITHVTISTYMMKPESVDYLNIYEAENLTLISGPKTLLSNWLR